jgi:hypothetical protein
MIPCRLERYRMPPGRPKAPHRKTWTSADRDGRQTCIPCQGMGERNHRECKNCDGDGYRWLDLDNGGER